MNISIAHQLTNNTKKAKIIPYKNLEKYRSFNNTQINIISILQMDLKSGSWNASNCQVLLVEKKTQNTMGRDILQKHGITLTASRNSRERLLHMIETNNVKWIIQKFPQLCTRLGRSKHHIAKPTTKKNFTPVQQKAGEFLYTFKKNSKTNSKNGSTTNK